MKTRDFLVKQSMEANESSQLIFLEKLQHSPLSSLPKCSSPTNSRLEAFFKLPTMHKTFTIAAIIFQAFLNRKCCLASKLLHFSGQILALLVDELFSEKLLYNSFESRNLRHGTKI